MSPPTESTGGSSIHPSAALSSRAAPFSYRAFRADGCVNAVTTGAGDPISRQPELKFSAVRLEKVEA